MAEKNFDLTDNLQESQFSGLSELPEVKSTLDWLNSGGSGDFREMFLDEVIQQRKELPEWSKNIEEQTLPEYVSKKVFYDGEGEGMNKIGEFFYTTKDAFASAIKSMPTDVMRFLSASAKSLGVSEDLNTKTLNALDDYRNSVDFDKSLRDFRLGVESDAFSNEIANVFGQMGSILIGAGMLKGAGLGAKVAAGTVEGLAEGGSYLATDIASQRQREGGLAEYKGEGLGFATAYGVLSGMIGAKGVEASFLDNLGKFTGKKFLKEAIVGEMGEEILQSALERSERGIQNFVYGTDTDQKTLVQDLLYVGKNGLLGAIGGASLGGVAYVNNHKRMKEMLVDNFGLTKADASKLAWQYLEDANNALLRNTTALQDMSPESRVMQFSKEQLMRDGQTEEQANKTLARIRRDIIKQQIKNDEELSKNDFFEQSKTTDGLVEYLRVKTGVQAIEDSVVEEEKQKIADRRVELESQEEITPEQPIVNNLKQAQFDIVQANNPMHDDYHVGIRSVDDIKSFDETIDDEESFVWGDYSREDAKRDLEKGTVTVYSSYPIEQGTFVSTSRNQAMDYAGGKNAKIYTQEVPITDVAWISGDEGQFAKTEMQAQQVTEQKVITKQTFDYKKYISDEELQNIRSEIIQKLNEIGINATATNNISQDGAVYISIPGKGTVRIGITEITKRHPDNIIANFDALSVAVDEILSKIQELQAQDNVPGHKTRPKGGMLVDVNNGKFAEWRAEQAKLKPTPIQLELNFLNAQENAINKAVGIETDLLPVDDNLLTKKDIDDINQKVADISKKLDSISATPIKTETQKAELEVGKELNSFEKPKKVESKYASRVAKQTKTEGISPILHNVRDMKAAKTAANEFVEREEDSAWEILENDSADTRGFLRAEIAEALKRKIAKIQDSEIRKAQLKRLISAYSNVSTRAGQELRALADDSLVDAIRDAAVIESLAAEKIKRAVKNKANKVQKSVDKITKSNKIMTDKKFWDIIKEQMECK